MSAENTQFIELMQRCLALAEKGGRATAPNPMVGCVIVKNGQIIAQGHHQRFGGPHAEVEALHALPTGAELNDALLCVNLEPCSHTGKTPPCADALIRSGIRQVLIGQRDPNPVVSGSGIRRLEAAGVRVIQPICHTDCLKLNRRFNTAHLRKRPYIILKWAQTADGFIARRDYSSKWISALEARTHAHGLRAGEQAILVGPGTAHYDDPALTVRHVLGVNPLRLVLDPRGSLSPTLKLFSDGGATWRFTQRATDPIPQVEHIHLPADPDQPSCVSVTKLLDYLHKHSIHSVLVEGGAHTHRTFLNAGLWDEVFIYVSKVTFSAGIPAACVPGEPTAQEPIGPDTLLHYHNTTQPSLAMLLDDCEINGG